MQFLSRIRLSAPILLAVLLLDPVNVRAETIRHYDWITAGKVSGSHVRVIRDDGTRVTDFEFNDRGRGPSIHEELKADQNGMLASLKVSGRSYLGAPVDETFQVQGDLASWKSTLEHGQAAPGAFYWASEGTLEQMALLARVLLTSDSGQVDLLPAGNAGIKEVTRYQGAVLYAISGLDLTPQYLWLDQEGELYALAGGWMGLAPRGESAILPVLQDIQDREEEKYHRDLAKTLTQALPEHWLIRNVSVVDVEKGTLIPRQLVAVSGGVIVRVSDDKGIDLPVYGDLQPRIIDGQGLTLIPGLWDMHTHLSLEDGLMHIAAGVTHTRDLGNDAERLAQVRAAFDEGAVIGPRSTAAGFIDRKSPYSAPTGSLAENLGDALRMVDEYAAAGYSQIKIYSSIEPAWVKPLADEIHRQNMRLSGHIPSFMTTRQAVMDGFDEIQHINMLFLNFLAGPQDDTRTPLRFSLVAEKAGDMDLDAPQVAGFIEFLKQKGVVVDPTVSIFDSMFRHRSGELDPSYAMIADHLPPSVRRRMLAGAMDVNDENVERYARSADALLQMIARLHAARVPLVAGTDAMAGFTLHRELELYRRAGLSNSEVLNIATLGSARVAGMGDQAGSISVGKRADFVLLATNPLEDISAVRGAVAVFKGDRWYDSAQLYEAVGIRPFTR